MVDFWNERDDIFPEHDWKYEKEQQFLGNCVGVVLRQRGPHDPHVCFHFALEDDETWHLKDYSFSSFWLTEFQQCLREAFHWLVQHAVPDMNEHGEVYGYKFKEEGQKEKIAVETEFYNFFLRKYKDSMQSDPMSDFYLFGEKGC